MPTTYRNIVAVAIACSLALPAASRAQDDSVSPQATPVQDLRSPDARDAGTTSSLAGTTSDDVAVEQKPYSGPATDRRSPDARDAADGRGTFNTPDVTVVKLPQPAPVHADRGVDWADAGIGAAILFALAVCIAGATAIGRRRRQRPRTAAAA
jgi:hypothetical protein